MEFYEAIDKRRTVRDFEDKIIDIEIIKRILSAGLKAPTNDHLKGCLLWQRKKLVLLIPIRL